MSYWVLCDSLHTFESRAAHSILFQNISVSWTPGGFLETKSAAGSGEPSPPVRERPHKHVDPSHGGLTALVFFCINKCAGTLIKRFCCWSIRHNTRRKLAGWCIHQRHNVARGDGLRLHSRSPSASKCALTATGVLFWQRQRISKQLDRTRFSVVGALSTA